MDGATTTFHTFVGLDVAKAKFDGFILAEGKPFTLPNDPQGSRQLIERLRAFGPCLIVVEASGGYERRLIADLLDAGLTVARVNPKRVRDYARALNLQAKTDRLDAQLLARFAEAVQPRPLEKTPEKQRELEELVGRRRQLLELRTAEKNRQETTTSKRAGRSIAKVLAVLDDQLADIDAAIAELIASDEGWQDEDQRLQSVPGVGAVTSATLIAEMPELGRVSRQEITALVGLAPYNRDSGQYQGQRRISGGRACVRSCLYMAALSARRCNPLIRRFAERLAATGKSYKVVMTACMRKLLILLNNLVKTQQQWNPQTAR